MSCLLRLLNWLFVTDYWIQLSALVHTAPTLYSVTLRGRPNFSHPTIYPSTNNIFVNETLFQIHSSYLQETILPLIRIALPDLTLPQFLPLNDSNRLQPVFVLQKPNNGMVQPYRIGLGGKLRSYCSSLYNFYYHRGMDTEKEGW